MNHSSAHSEVPDCAFSFSNRDFSFVSFFCENLRSTIGQKTIKFMAFDKTVSAVVMCVCVCVLLTGDD